GGGRTAAGAPGGRHGLRLGGALVSLVGHSGQRRTRSHPAVGSRAEHAARAARAHYQAAAPRDPRAARALFLEWLDGYLREDPTRGDRALRVALDAARRRMRYPRLFRIVDGA